MSIAFSGCPGSLLRHDSSARLLKLSGGQESMLNCSFLRCKEQFSFFYPSINIANTVIHPAFTQFLCHQSYLGWGVATYRDATSIAVTHNRRHKWITYSPCGASHPYETIRPNILLLRCSKNFTSHHDNPIVPLESRLSDAVTFITDSSVLPYKQTADTRTLPFLCIAQGHAPWVPISSGPISVSLVVDVSYSRTQDWYDPSFTAGFVVKSAYQCPRKHCILLLTVCGQNSLTLRPSLLMSNRPHHILKKR